MKYRLRTAEFVPENESVAHSAPEAKNFVNRRDVSLRRVGHWSTEIYSFGSLYRELLQWPKWRRLPFTSEHGIPFGTSSVKYALDGWNWRGSKLLHLTWSRDVELRCHEFDVPVIRIPHPWAVGWRAKNLAPFVIREGPLLIVPHSLPDVPLTESSSFWNRFLSSLSSDLRPSVALLSFHDLGGEVEQVFHTNKIPVYCVGLATSDFFFDRFYHILSQFRFSIGPNISSASFYSEDFGVPFLRVGEELVFDYSEHKEKLGKWSEMLHDREEFRKVANEYFMTPIPQRTHSLTETNSLVAQELSLDLLDFDFGELGVKMGSPIVR